MEIKKYSLTFTSIAVITLLRIMGTFEKSEGLLLKNGGSPGAPCPPWSDQRSLQVQLFGVRFSSASEWSTFHFLLQVGYLISCYIKN